MGEGWGGARGEWRREEDGVNEAGGKTGSCLFCAGGQSTCIERELVWLTKGEMYRERMDWNGGGREGEKGKSKS